MTSESTSAWVWQGMAYASKENAFWNEKKLMLNLILILILRLTAALCSTVSYNKDM